MGGCVCVLCGQAGTAQAKPPSSAAEATTAAGTAAPSLVAQVELTYPEAALEFKKHATVSLLVEVNTSGKVVKRILRAALKSSMKRHYKMPLCCLSRLPCKMASL